MNIETEEAYKELQGYYDNSECFYCGEIISPPMIVWSGTTSFIQFHPDCAATFQILFARDLYEFKQSSGLVLEFGLSRQEKLRIDKEMMAEWDDTFPQRNVQLAVPDFQFVDGGSEKVHIRKEKWAATRCSHFFKHYRIIEARELDSDDVCHHCIQQGGVRIYPTGKRIKWDESSWPPKRIVIDKEATA